MKLSEMLAEEDKIIETDLNRLGRRRKRRQASEICHFGQISKRCLHRYKKKGVEKHRCRFWDYQEPDWEHEWTKPCNMDNCPGMNGEWGTVESGKRSKRRVRKKE